MTLAARDLAGFPPEVASALAEGAARHGRRAASYVAGRPPLAVFDWDNTCIRNDIGDAAFERAAALADIRLDEADLALLLPERLGGRPRREPILRALARAREGPAEAARDLQAELLSLYEDLGPAAGQTERYKWVAAMLAGRTEAELEALAAATFDRGLADLLAQDRISSVDGRVVVRVARGIRVYPAMAHLIRGLIEEGWDVRIVTASAEPLVRPLALRVGVGPERVVGARLAADEATGRLLPRVLEPFPYAAGKLAAIERFAGRPPLLVAGDSPGDLDMLRSSLDLRLVIEATPDSEAAAVARASGWLVAGAADLLVRGG